MMDIKTNDDYFDVCIQSNCTKSAIEDDGTKNKM